MNSTAPLRKKMKKAEALIGTVVNGKYKIRALVAAGGMGAIYEAEQIALSRSVALKVLHTTTEVGAEHDPQFKKRFLREASILARLQHPNIVTIFDYGAIEGPESDRCFISMEFCSGETLAQRISRCVTIPREETIRIVRQIARGLKAAHAHGVIHRDLKPSNVMLLRGRDGEEQVKLVDFGIVKIIGDDSKETEDLTQEGAFVGTPKYIAPEQITRSGAIDVRTDVYSFGIILYHCLTGTVPFDRANAIETLMAHVNQAPQPMRERAPSADIPEWLDALVMSCIEKEPEKRPQTMDVVAKTLASGETALTSSPILAEVGARGSFPSFSGDFDVVRPEGEAETNRTTGWRRSPLLVVAVVAAGATFVVMLGVSMFYRAYQQPSLAPVTSPAAAVVATTPTMTFAIRPLIDPISDTRITTIPLVPAASSIPNHTSHHPKPSASSTPKPKQNDDDIPSLR
jgi:serine/threonine protein kinase